jgi:hypothetical protein
MDKLYLIFESSRSISQAIHMGKSTKAAKISKALKFLSDVFEESTALGISLKTEALAAANSLVVRQSSWP